MDGNLLLVSFDRKQSGKGAVSDHDVLNQSTHKEKEIVQATKDSVLLLGSYFFVYQPFGTYAEMGR